MENGALYKCIFIYLFIYLFIYCYYNYYFDLVGGARRHVHCWIDCLKDNDNNWDIHVKQVTKQGTKQFNFPACPNFLKKFFSKTFTCLLGKLRVKSTSPTTKSTSPGLSDTNFFVPCQMWLHKPGSLRLTWFIINWLVFTVWACHTITLK